MPEVLLPWGKCHYRVSGDGPALLLIHSSSQTSRVFEPLMDVLSDYRLIAPDMPGFGDSDPLPDGVSMEEIAGHLVRLLDRLGIEKTHVFGVHSGNKVGAALAANWPERVARVVLAGMTHSLVIDQEARNRAMLGYVANKSGAGNAVNVVQGVAGTYRANLAFDFAAALERITAAVLLIELTVGNEEHLGRQAHFLAQRMQACTPVAITGDDQQLLRDSSEKLAKLLRSFLG